MYNFSGVTISSVSDYVDEVLHGVKAALSLEETDAVFYTIQLSLWEMFANIITHSQQNDEQKMDLTVSWTEKQVSLVFLDHGIGFDSSDTISSASISEVDQIGGRGLYLIQSLAEHFSYDETGRQATIILSRNNA